MNNNTWDKVLFGMWLLWTFMYALLFIAGVISGDPEYHELFLFMCGVFICQLLWELWHTKQANYYINILVEDKDE